MSKIKVAVAVVIVLALFVIPITAFAQPPVCGFYGSVTVDGGGVADGTTVKAWIDQVEAKSVTTTGSKYHMAIGGSYTGKVVYFTVGETPALVAGSGIWEAGRNKKLDLTATTSSPGTVGQAEISLNPAEGMTTTVSGIRFTPNSTVIITWGGEVVPTVPATVAIDGNGTFSAVIVASTNTAGDYIIKVTDVVGRSAEATFAVVDVRGDPGVQGLQGDPGPQGTKGDQGPKGDPGLQGPKGDSGGTTVAVIAIVFAVIAAVLAIAAAVFVYRFKKTMPQV